MRKALEFPLALWIDLVLPKRRILEIYLNVAEWGPGGEFGVEAGARRAFGKSARDLTPGEAALLAAVLPNPHRAQRASGRGPGVRRIAARIQGRAAAAGDLDACVRARVIGTGQAGGPSSISPASRRFCVSGAVARRRFQGDFPWLCRRKKPRRPGAACAARPTR